MKPADLIKPISPDAPCGEDLLDADDPEFVDYYFNVEDRLPTTYFDLRNQTLFDSKTIDAKAEGTQIEALLKRSRDLRLIGIDAKFQILAGRFKGFADAVLGMAALLETYPDDVLPKSNQERQNAIEELNSNATIVAPLDYAVLFSDRRAGDMIYRPYATGSGKIAPREGEEPGDSAKIQGILSNAENAKLVDQLYSDLVALKAAVASILATAKSRGFYPKLDRLESKLGDLLDMVVSARGDLGAAPAGAVDQAQPEGSDASAAPASGGTITMTVQTGTAEVPDHKAAYRLLSSVEGYFASHEPASLALVLVMQSRLLIGRPLVEALDVLMEDSASRASITFGGDTGFTISMSRMRDLSANAPVTSTDDMASTAWDPGPEGEPAEVPTILSRDHAGMILKQVEDFYRTREPASPIPILLFKARNMLTKDFHALVRDLLPPNPY